MVIPFRRKTVEAGRVFYTYPMPHGRRVTTIFNPMFAAAPWSGSISDFGGSNFHAPGYPTENQVLEHLVRIAETDYVS